MSRLDAALNRLLVLSVLGAGLLGFFSCFLPNPVEDSRRPPLAATSAPAPSVPPAASPSLASSTSRQAPSRGRGLTPAPRAAFTALPLIEKTADGLLVEAGRLPYADRGALRPTAVVLHTSGGKNLAQTIAALEARNLAVHFFVDEAGRAIQAMDSLEHQGKAARGLDDAAIHIEILGGPEKALLENRPQRAKLVELLRALVLRYDIPAHNHDVVAKQGIFAHGQVIKRHGGLIPNDPLHPGDEYMKAVFAQLGGKFLEEKDWKDRYEDGWHFVLENPASTAKRGDLTKGRGLTPTPKAALPEVEQTADGLVLEDRRLQYVDRGRITVSGIVLHFTATDTYEFSQRVLEDRRLCPTLMVDVDGKAYQCLDALDDRPAAAAETNAFAVQIEIVAKGEETLLANEPQKAKVKALVDSLCARFQIPRTNADIDSARGIFSHGQQKKRWGHSAWLHPGTDFDPGERYMKEILETVGGTYVPDAEWKDRKDEKWVILSDDWTP